MYLVAVGVLGHPKGFCWCRCRFMPVLADTVCSGKNAVVAQVAMRLVAGPAQADRLAFLDIPQAFSRKAL